MIDPQVAIRLGEEVDQLRAENAKLQTEVDALKNGEFIAAAIKDRDYFEKERDALQAKIDSLMLAYCPEEMTPEQLAEWAKHQKAVPPEEAKRIDAQIEAALSSTGNALQDAYQVVVAKKERAIPLTGDEIERINAAADAVTYGVGVLHGDKHVPAHELYAEQPDPVLCSFYQVETFTDLVKAMERHIEKLQAKVPTLRDTQPGRVREG